MKPDLVMVSACLNGQTGPHHDYPGFGGQGSALAGYNSLTGWPDREPVGPDGTITDSLAPRFVATALAAALLYRRRTGPRRLPRRLAGRVRDLQPGAVAARLRGRRRDPTCATATATPARCRTARSRAPTKAMSATVGSRSRAGPTTSGPRSRASSELDDPSLATSPRAADAATRSKRSSPAGRARGRAPTSPTQLQAAGIEAVPVAGLRRPARRPAARGARPLRAAHAPVPRRRALRAQRLPPLGSAGAATTAPARRSARTPTGCSATCSGSTTARSTRCAASGAVE